MRPIETFTLRSPGDEDAAGIAALSRAMAAEVGISSDTSEQDVLRSWTAPRFDRERHARVVKIDGTVVGYARLAIETDEAQGGGSVAPDARGRGIGTALLAFLVETARAEPNVATLYAGAHSARTDAHALIERFGFTFTRTFFRMLHPSPGDVAEPRLPAGIRVETGLRGDALLDALIAAHDGSFIDHWNFHPWQRDDVQHHLDDPETDLDLLHVAFGPDGSVAGLNLCFLMTGEDFVRGVVGVLGTTRPYRGIGLGSALLRLGVQALADRGATEVELGVDAENPTGALGIYERCGFTRESATRVYRLDLA